jgi:hypothetical protein
MAPLFLSFQSLERERKYYGEKTKAWNLVSKIAYNIPNNNNNNTWTNTIRGRSIRGNVRAFPAI